MGQPSLQKFHRKVVSNAWLKLFAAVVRGWLAVGFIIPGLKKVTNNHFAPGIGVPHIKEFFDAFFQATEFYLFVGLVQVVSGLLLLFPSTTALGAVLYFPVIINIFFITVALSFKGTWIITGLMVLANLFLLCWEFDRWQALLPGVTPSGYRMSNHHLNCWETLLAAGLSGLLTMALLFTGLGVLEGTDIFYPLLTAAFTLLLAVYFLFRYHSRQL